MALKKERTFAIVIGLLMIGSVAGFAVSFGLGGVNFDQPVTLTIDTVVYEKLTPEEVIYLLRSGKIIIRDYYNPNCTYCMERSVVLQGFTNSLKEYAVMESVQVNETTSLSIVGRGGTIKEIKNETLNENELLGLFCDLAIIVPKECLLLG